MNEANCLIVSKAVALGGKELQGKLPDSPRHPKGRNPYAHIWKCLKSKYRKSYKDISDDKVDEVLGYIHYLVNHPF